MVSRGYLTLFHVRGVPVRFHWSLPLLAFLAGRLQFVPGLWLGFLLLVLLHEAGHALVVRATGNEVLSVDVLGIGGLCRWDGDPTPIQRALIAWGGVWAQMALWVGTKLVLLATGAPTTSFVAQMVDAFTSVNLWLMLVNLLPIPPLDGAEAWPLFGLLWARRKRRLAVAKTAARSAAIAKARVSRTDSEARVSRPDSEARVSRPKREELLAAARREADALKALDDVENGVTPEVEDVLTRVRELSAEEAVREAALRPGRPSRDP